MKYIAFFFAFLSVTSCAHAFDCAAARAPVEKEICAHHQLKAADDALVQTYVAVLKRSDAANRDVLIESERRWLNNRAKCVTSKREPAASCIERDTLARIGNLERSFGSSDEPVSPVRATPAAAFQPLHTYDCAKPSVVERHPGAIASVCADTRLLAALRSVRDDYDHALARRPLAERHAFEVIVGPLTVVPTNCYKDDGAIDHACALAATKANKSLLASYDGYGPDAVGRLRFVYREREVGDGAKIHITYALFEKPRDAAERLFNKLILDAVWRDELTDPFDAEFKERTASGRKIEGFSDVSRIDVAGDLLTFAVENWDCCGAHGFGGTSYTSIVKSTGELFDPASTFDMSKLAAACWTNFKGSKDISFLQDEDQYDKAVLNEKALHGLAELVGDQHAWHVVGGKANLDFGIIGGYAGGPSGCDLSHDDLVKALKAGRTLPSH